MNPKRHHTSHREILTPKILFHFLKKKTNAKNVKLPLKVTLKDFQPYSENKKQKQISNIVKKCPPLDVKHGKKMGNRREMFSSKWKLPD